LDDLSSWNWPAVNDVVDDTIQEELKVSDMEFTMEINARTRACSSPNSATPTQPPPLRRQGTLTGGGTITSHDVLGPPAFSDGLGFCLEEEM